MKSERKLGLVAICTAFTMLAAGAPAVAAERPYDGAVAKMIDSANSGLGKFTREMSSKAKGAKVKRGEAEVDISDFLDDFKTEGRRLDEHFAEGKSADQNALEFLRKAKGTDEFIARHPAGSALQSIP